MEIVKEEEKMVIDAEKAIIHLEEIYKCGEQPDGTFSRIAYSKEDVKGRELFRSWFAQLGIPTRVDEAGNIIARMEGKDSSLPAIVMGSHLDTVPDGGKYDGVVGCVGGLAVCEAMKEAGYVPNHPLEVVVFTDEEGFRFGSGLFGSSAICGVDAHASEHDVDMYGMERKDVVKSYGIHVEDAQKAKKDPKDVKCFLELHVEQGARLDKSGTPIGVVSSIAGVTRFEIEITGEANHAGSTAMSDRKDALVAASNLIARIPEIVKKNGTEFTVATVGTIKVTPNSVNVIPGSCLFHLEIRDQERSVMDAVGKEAFAYLQKVCEENGLSFRFQKISDHAPEPMKDWVKDAIEESVKELGYEYAVIPSGAFHDSLTMAPVFPTGMIFVPSKGGISHSRYEFTESEDIGKGCQVLLNTVLKVDNMK